MDREGLELIEPGTLYNILQHANVTSCLSNPNYLLLADARSKNEYSESHVLTAKKAPKDIINTFRVPYDAELECKQTVVVYDRNTSSLKDENSPALEYGLLLWNMGSRNPVKILRGGFELFSSLYPFLRTQKVFYMPRELDAIMPYPVEILHGFLYLGNWHQGNAVHIQKDLKITGHVNVTEEKDTYFREAGPELLHIKVEDNFEADLFHYFEIAFSFIDSFRRQKEAVLVFSKLGISRGVVIVMAYLMKHKTWPMDLTYHYVKKCQPALQPYQNFVEQLSRWEEILFGATTSHHQ